MGANQPMGGIKAMKNDYWDTQEHELPVYRQLLEGIGEKTTESIEEMCESFLFEEGINVRFLPSEINGNYPSVVRSFNGNYSVGIPLKGACRQHYYAEAVYIIYKEWLNPGFLGEYVRRHEILNEIPHVLEILKIEYMLLMHD